MISFKQFISEFEKKFVCLYFDEATNKKLMKYAMDNGFNLSVKYDGTSQQPKDFDFHITVYYSSSTHNDPDQDIKLDKFEVKPDHFAALGENHDVPVLKLKNEGQIKNIRDMFTSQGYTDNWPDYKPHISLSYERKPYSFKDMKLPDFPIVVDRLSVRKQ